MNQKILIVDDNKKNLAALERSLLPTGAEVIKATSGNDALKATLHHDFAIAILDVQMPGMDGYELAEILRAETKTHHMPLIFLTAVFAEEHQIFKGYQAGGVDFIVKPYIPEALVNKVKIFLELDRQKRELLKHQDHLESLVEERTGELRNNYRQLLEAEASYREIFNAASDSILIYDPDTGALVDANQKACELFQCSREEMLGRQQAESGKRDFEGPSEDVVYWVKRTKNEGPQTFEHTRRRGGGEPTYEEINMRVATISGKERVIAVIRDVTRRRKLEEQIYRSQKMESVGNLAGGIAHDFNNILIAILRCIEFIETGPAEEDGFSRYVELAKDCIDRGSALTQQLLALSSRQVLSLQVLDLNGLVSGLEKMLQRLIGEDIDFKTILASRPATIKADPGKIEQVVLNLVLNARDAMATGGRLTIETAHVLLDDDYACCHLSVSPGHYVMLTIADTGCGMDEETKSRMFEPFFTTKETGRGTGLGLSTTYGIIKQSGGHMECCSEPGQGSIFNAYLPYVEGKPQPAAPTQAPRPESAPLTGNILLVEDDETVRKLLGEDLENAGYHVVQAGSGSEALRICSDPDCHIDILLTDVVMPEIGGTKLAKVLGEAFPDLKILYMSGHTEDAVIRHGLTGEGINFLQKPFSNQMLLRKLQEML